MSNAPTNRTDDCTLSNWWEDNRELVTASGLITVRPVADMIRSTPVIRTVFLNLGIDLDLAPDNVTEAVLQMFMNNGNDVARRVRTEFEKCFPEFRSEGRGATPTDRLQDLWNRNGNALLDRIDDNFEMRHRLNFTANRVPRNVFREWRTSLFEAFNCVESLIEKSIFCKNPPGPRCRIEAKVERCIERAPSQ